MYQPRGSGILRVAARPGAGGVAGPQGKRCPGRFLGGPWTVLGTRNRFAAFPSAALGPHPDERVLL